MRKLLSLTLLCTLAAPALAWIPKLDEAAAKPLIDGAFGRRDLPATYGFVDLNVKDGQFAGGPGAVRVFDGSPACLSDWLAAPAGPAGGSRPTALLISGQADQLVAQARQAAGEFKNLSAAQAMGETYAKDRLPDGELRLDISVRGLPSEKSRDAYMVRLRAGDGRLVAPTRRSYVNDFKEGADGLWTGTLVYYFRPLEANVGASDAVEVLFRTEADTDCAYGVPLNLGSFQ